MPGRRYATRPQRCTDLSPNGKISWLGSRTWSSIPPCEPRTRPVTWKISMSPSRGAAGRRTPAHRGRLRIRRRVRAGQRLLAHPGAQRPGTLPVRHPRPSDIIRRLPALSLAGRFRGVRPRPLALGQTRTHPGATAPPQSAGRATLPGRREARPDAANHPGAVPKPTSSCGTSSRLKTSTSHSPAQSSSPPASTPRLRARLDREDQLVADAEQRGWQREVERHQATKRRLEQLLHDLA